MEKSKTNKVVIVILSVIIVVLVCLLIYQQTNLKDEVREKILVINEKDSLKNEYSQLLMEYEGLQSTNEQINLEIEAQKEKIRTLLKEVEVYKGDAMQLKKYKKELATLREIMKSYVRQIDSLNTVNKALTQEITEIKSDYKEVSDKYAKTIEENVQLTEKVKIASKLEAFNIKALGVRMKSNNVEKETDKISKTEKIKICFTIGKNPVTQKGTKEIYIRITQPDSLILTPGPGDEYAFNYEGKLINYSIKERINYEGEELNLCGYWQIKEKLKPGIYTIDIFADGEHIGIGNFSLK